MVSRKKSKGKERKAKKVEAKRAEISRVVYEDWLGWTKGKNEVLRKNIECRHGCGCILPTDIDHPVSKFMNDFITYRDADKNADYSTVKMMCATFQTHPNVWNNNGYKEMLLNILTSMGTNLLLMELMEPVLNKDKGMLWALRIADTLAVLENYNGGSFEMVFSSRKVLTKLRDFGISVGSGKSRDVLKFYSKRISCSCLKTMHQEARRTQPKTGLCFGCGEEMERVALSVCSRCIIAQYCSRQCQVADWREHETDCDMYVKTQKQQTQTVEENEIEMDE